MARIYYNGAQSLLFFTLVMAIGKAYDVELNDDWAESKPKHNKSTAIWWIYNKVRR